MKSYHDLLRHILHDGDNHRDRTGVGTTSVFGYQLRHAMTSGFPLLTTKKMFLRGIVEELVWFLSGRTDVGFLQQRGVKIWDAWATQEQCARFQRETGDLGPIYGHQWRMFGTNHHGDALRSLTDPIKAAKTFETLDPGVDQIAVLCNDLRHNPGSRRMIVTGWNPREATQVALPPCHTLFQVKVTEGKDGCHYLDLQLYQRSADSFLGVPFNIASYALLLQLLAHTHNLVPRYFIHTFGDLHVYNNHVDQVNLQLAREPRTLPRVQLDPRLLNGGLDAVLDFKYEDVQLVGYDPHDAIKAPVAV